jgi:hypothetical protein
MAMYTFSQANVMEHSIQVSPMIWYEGFTSTKQISSKALLSSTGYIHSYIMSSTTVSRGAIEREKVIKGWLRKRKLELIEMNNPQWKDLSMIFLILGPS